MRNASCLLIAGLFACASPSPSSDDPGQSHEGEGEGITGPTDTDADLLEVTETDTPCTTASDCETALGEDACRAYSCSGAWYCTYTAPDQDEDGAVDEDCGGSDCEDGIPSIPGGEDCDTFDNDCDGYVDEGLANVACPGEDMGCGRPTGTQTCMSSVYANENFEGTGGASWSGECQPSRQPCSLTGEWNINMVLNAACGGNVCTLETRFVFELTASSLIPCPPATLEATIDQLEMNCTGDMSPGIIPISVEASGVAGREEPGMFININCEGSGYTATFSGTSNMLECGNTFTGTYSGDMPFQVFVDPLNSITMFPSNVPFNASRNRVE